MKKVPHWIKIILTGLVTGLCNGIFGSGGGTIVVPSMVHILDFEEHDAHATALAVILPLTIVSSIIYLKNDLTAWPIVWKVSIGGVLGGMVGAWILNKISAYWLQKIFALFMIAAALRMII